MLTKYLRLGASACIAMAFLSALAVDAAAACNQFSVSSTAVHKGDAIGRARDGLFSTSSNAGKCQPARIGCKRRNNKWTCTAARSCCTAGARSGTGNRGRYCTTFRASGKIKGPVTQLNTGVIRKALAAKIENFRTQNNGRAVCQPETLSCPGGQVLPGVTRTCSARRKCCSG